MLLDAGESAWAQLVRSYGGTAAAAQQVAGLAAVWISHRHADHMLGLPCLLAHRPRRCPPLLIIGDCLLDLYLHLILILFVMYLRGYSEGRTTDCALSIVLPTLARR